MAQEPIASLLHVTGQSHPYDVQPLEIIVAVVIVLVGMSALLCLAALFSRSKRLCRPSKHAVEFDDMVAEAQAKVLECRQAGKYLDEAAAYDTIMMLRPDLADAKLDKVRALTMTGDEGRQVEAIDLLARGESFFTAPREKLIAEYLAAYLYILFENGEYSSRARLRMTDLFSSGVRAEDWDNSGLVRMAEGCRVRVEKSEPPMAGRARPWIARGVGMSTGDTVTCR
ncbi:MAG: hypothetical protein QGD94_01030 [Planctomycetia bacterium]|nr:hypothetical protein [Planctomycetia bacterium]